MFSAQPRVALRKESVDRNVGWLELFLYYQESLSARRAWIEMDWASVITAMTSVALRKESVDRNGPSRYQNTPISVALRKESVDRNIFVTSCPVGCFLSLSARRAWIEIIMAATAPNISSGRSPQGERG